MSNYVLSWAALMVGKLARWTATFMVELRQAILHIWGAVDFPANVPEASRFSA